jgi:prefoldin alpha subunit
MQSEDTEQGWFLLQQYRNQIEELYAQVELIERLVADYAKTLETLQELSNVSDTDSLILLGGNTYAYGTLTRTDRVIVNVGRGTLIEKPVSGAIDTLQKKVEDLRKSQENVLQAAETIRVKMDDLYRRLNEQNVQVSET